MSNRLLLPRVITPLLLIIRLLPLSAIIFPLENDKRKWMLNAANGEMIKSIHIDDFMNNDFLCVL